MLTALLLAMQSAAIPAEPASTTYSDITIIDVSELPPFGSGLIATFVGIVGRTPSGEITTFYLPFMHAGQPVPVPSSVCTFETRPMSRPITAFSAIKGRNINVFNGLRIDNFRCALTSESSAVAPPAVRVTPFMD